ncbi:MAG: hypothetical protein A4E57_02474 [Syntrophorhabdaceae bacterium PtaU1.Bin034]|nr:MAG: hypothetical protein A4E57_02474 [Syntrophorhabdaceae bacterium PtaU1.Bin034]
MHNILKILIFTSPILAIVFWYVVSMQSKHDTHIHLEDAAFERVWNETEATLSKSTQDKDKYLARAREAEERLLKYKAKEAEKEKKSEEFQQKFEKELEEADKAKGGNK